MLMLISVSIRPAYLMSDELARKGLLVEDSCVKAMYDRNVHERSCTGGIRVLCTLNGVDECRVYRTL